jgi:hypothetical protein
MKMKEVLSPASKAAAPAVRPEDLSAEILKTVERAPGDRVTCRHIVGDHYRCNWWGQQNTDAYDNPAMLGLMVTTHRVRKSAFLKVTRTPEGLSIGPVLPRP